MERRKFLQLCGLLYGGLVAKPLLNILEAGEDNKPKAKDDYDTIFDRLENKSYKVTGQKFGGCEKTVIYLEDIHLPGFQLAREKTAKEILELFPGSDLGLEGLTGRLSNEQIKELQEADKTVKRVSKRKKQLEKEIQEAIRHAVPYLSDIPIAIDMAEMIARGLTNRQLQQKNSEGVAPGGDYAIRLNDIEGITIYGVEDQDLYNWTVDVCLGQTTQKSLKMFNKVINDAEEIKEKTPKHDEALKYLKQCREQLRNDIKHYQKRIGVEDIEALRSSAEYEKKAIELRSATAINKLTEQGKSKVCVLIYGSGHKDSIIKHCQENKQNYILVGGKE
jgi:hypothetical protein